MAKTTNNPAGRTDAGEVDDALAQAQAAVDQIAQQANTGFGMADLSGLGGAGASAGGLEMLGDVELDVSIELGRTEMLVEDILRLSEGSVLELDKLAGDPVDVYVNQRLVARGEVLVLNDNFCIRISEIVDDLKEQAVEAAAANAVG